SDLHAGDAGCGGLAEVAQTETHPAHQVLVVKDADDVLGPALRIKYWHPRVLTFHNAAESIVKLEVGRQRKNVGPSHHHFFHGDRIELDGAVNHLFLKFGNLAELAAGGDDELEL